MPATTDYLPSREADLVVWSTNFNALVAVNFASYGLTSAQATGYTTLHTAFVTAYNTANSDSTRTPASIVAKNAAKTSLIADARLLAGIIQKCPTVTNTQRSALGLTIKNAPSPIPPPANAPTVEITGVNAFTVKVRLHDSTSGSKRGKPAGVTGASVFSFVGATAPTDITQWQFEGNTGRTIVDVNFPNSTAAGAKVWITAFWFNGRKQSGPASSPISTNIQGGGVALAA